MPGKRKIAAACLVLAAAFAAWLAGLDAFVRDVAALPPPRAAQKLDAIVVLTGGSNRLDSGFDLQEQGFGKKLFISGVYRGTEVKPLLRRWRAEPQSSLDCCVVLGFEADNTAGNARESVKWLRGEGYRSLYLVTANYHIKRAMLEFKKLAPDLAIIPYPVAPEKINLAAWQTDPYTRGMMAREYTKYVAARLLCGFTCPGS